MAGRQIVAATGVLTDAGKLSRDEADQALGRLFEQARRGDDEALSAVCQQMRPRLFRVAFSVLGDRDDADDVAQEALVRAVTRLFLFLGTGSVAGWMTRIAFNLAKNRRRDHRRRQEIVSSAPHADLEARGALARPIPRPDDALGDSDERRRLLDALQQLPQRQREVMELRAIAGLDFAAVADVLGIGEANARMSFSLAKKKLLTLLGGES